MVHRYYLNMCIYITRSTELKNLNVVCGVEWALQEKGGKNAAFSS